MWGGLGVYMVGGDCGGWVEVFGWMVYGKVWDRVVGVGFCGWDRR